MLLRVGCEFEYEASAPSPAVLLVEPHQDAPHRLLREGWQTEPDLALSSYQDLFENRCRRAILPEGTSRLRYDAVVSLTRDPDPVDLTATQALVEDLPDSVLVYTLPSRYCLSDVMADTAWRLFGETEPGWARVQAVCDWIHANIRYGDPGMSLPTSVDVFERGVGVCRDFAHMGVTLCRALTIPARYVFGYMPDIDWPPPYPPMDFHAWFEVYLGGQWWTFDARFNTPRVGRVPIGRGRDAIDVAMVTTYGAASFRNMIVWTDEVTDDASETPDTSLAVVGSEGGAIVEASLGA